MLWGNLEYAKRSDLSRGEVADLKATIAEQAAQITALTAAAEGARAGAFATDADVRRVAQAICLAGRDPPDPPDTPCDWEWWLNEAMAALKEMGFTIVDGALAAPATGDANG